MAIIVRNLKKAGIEITFEDQLSQQDKTWLAVNHFRWSKYNNLYWKQFSQKDWTAVHEYFNVPLSLSEVPTMSIENQPIKSFNEYLKEGREVYGWKNNEAIHEKYKIYLLREAYEKEISEDNFGTGIKKNIEDAEYGININLSKVKITDENSFLYAKRKIAELMDRARSEGKSIIPSREQPDNNIPEKPVFWKWTKQQYRDYWIKKYEAWSPEKEVMKSPTSRKWYANRPDGNPTTSWATKKLALTMLKNEKIAMVAFIKNRNMDWEYKAILENAIKEGKSIPEKVLIDYPELKTEPVKEEKPSTMKETTMYYKLKTKTIPQYLEFLKELKPYVNSCKIFSAGIGDEYLIIIGDYDKMAGMHPSVSVTDFDSVLSDSKLIQSYSRLNSKPTPEKSWRGEWKTIDERIAHLETVLSDDDETVSDQAVQEVWQEKTDEFQQILSLSKRDLEDKTTEELDNLINQLEEGATDIISTGGNTSELIKLKDLIGTIIDFRNRNNTEYNRVLGNQFAPSGKNKPGSMRPDFMTKNLLKGREIQLSMPNGEKRNALFAIVDLNNIIASHNEENFHSESSYPKNASGNNINDRNYSGDLSAQKAVMDYARELEPERLITTSRTPSGTPIVTKDGFVVSGNNRTMSLKLAAKNYPENYKEYVKFLGEEAESFGFAHSFVSDDKLVATDKNDVTVHFTQPVLVRIDLDFPEYTTQELAKYNKDTKKSERPIDKAIKLSNILRDNSRCAEIIAGIVGEYETFTEFYANIQAQKQLSKTLIECNLLTEQELPAFFSETTFTEAGKEFIESLLAALILDREALLATELPGVKAIRQKLLTALPVLMKNASLPEGSLKQKFNDAVILQYNIKGSTFADFIRQRTMFGDKYDRKTVYLNRLIDSGKIKFKQAIEGYNSAIMQNQGASLFGEKPSLDKIFNHWIIGGVSETDKKLIEGSDMVSKESDTKVPLDVIQPDYGKMKEPWQMTAKEYRDATEKTVGKPLDQFIDEQMEYHMKNQHPVTREQLEKQYGNHLDIIKEAIAQGNPVPENIRSEYPELQPKKDFIKDHIIIGGIPKYEFKPEPDYHKVFLREQEGMRLYLVDGEQVRKDHIEFVSGGHGFVYDWIPNKDEVWIDDNQKDKPADMEATIKHELFEIGKMRDEGLSYDDAHELANAMEKEVRNEQEEKNNPTVVHVLKNHSPYGIDRAIVSFINHNFDVHNEYFDRDLAIVEENPNYNTAEKLKKAIDRQIAEWEDKSLAITAEIAQWINTGGEYIKTLPAYAVEMKRSEGWLYLAEKAKELKGILFDAEKEVRNDEPNLEQERQLRVEKLIENQGAYIKETGTPLWEKREGNNITDPEVAIVSEEMTYPTQTEEEVAAIPEDAWSEPKITFNEWQQVSELDASYKIEVITKTDPMYVDGWRYEMTIGYPESLGENGNYDAGNFFKEMPDKQTIKDEIKNVITEAYNDLKEGGEFLSGRDESIKKALRKIIHPARISKPEVKDIFPDLTEKQLADTGLEDYVETLIKEEGKSISYTLSDYTSEYELNKDIEKALDEHWYDTSFFDDKHDFIRAYSGYGGLKEVTGNEELLKSMYEFYTPDAIVAKMWGLADKHRKFAIESVCEPSVGVGIFFDPRYVLSSVQRKTAYELNKYSARITKILYPDVIVNDGADSMKFEMVFTKNNYTIGAKIPKPTHDLVIGNPPYMEVSGREMGMGEGRYSHAKNYIDYFIFRGLDLLKKDGLLIYIVGAEVAAGGKLWLDQGDSKCKQAIAEKGKLIDAYRLPEGIFGRTNVVSDILIFRKKIKL